MIRFAGMLNPGQVQVDPISLDRMLQSMKHEEKEQPRFLIQGNVGFACFPIGTRKSGSPYLHPNLQWMIVFDGRIDNRQELIGLLRSQIFECSEAVSNEAIVLAAYEKWGMDFPKHLNGDFAIGLWDQGEHRLVCVRDHFGVKPLYFYCFQQDGFLFASTPLAILASGKVPPYIHEERIADHLVNPLEGVDKTSSFYKDIFRLPPAHMLVLQPGGVTVKRYWEVSPVIDEKLKTEEDYIEAFRELFLEAVRCRFQNKAETASTLSGGMDSSSIVGICRDILSAENDDPVQVFAAISNIPQTNRETTQIRSVLSQGHISSNLISETEIVNCMNELVGSIESEAEPFDCLMNLNRSIYLHAGKRNFSSVLDGIDGDALLTGSGYLLHLWAKGSLRTILKETIKADGLTAEYKIGSSKLFSSLLSVITPRAPEWFRDIRRPFRYRKTISNAVRESIIEHDFAIRAQLGERFARLHAYSPRPASLRQIDFHKNALDHPFLTVGLERYERVASAFGIEARHPFTDVRLAEFCLGLPWQLKTRDGWTKYILRRAMEPYLPDKVIWRQDKDSLMWEVNRLILKERADYFHQATLDEREALKPYVDTQKLQKFWHEYLTRGDETHSEQIWSGIALAFWLRRHRHIVRDLKLQQ